MSTLSIQLPNSLQTHLQKLAEREGISVEQFIATAVAERAKRGSRAKYEAALAQVPDVEPGEYDRLPSS
jgi:hypothetical protein